MKDILGVLSITVAIGGLVSALVTLFGKWLYDRVRIYKVKVGPVEVAIRPDDIDETWREIEEKVRELRENPRVFLSYAYTDREFAHRLAQDLRAEGIEVWIAEEQIRVGDSLTEKIGEAISTSQWVIFVLSENSLKSDFVSKEMELALKAERSRDRTLVLPVVYQVQVDELPPQLRDKMFADFRDNYSLGFKQLLSSVKRAVSHPSDSASASKQRAA